MDLCKYIKFFYNYSILFSLENNIMNNNYSYLIIINSNKLKNYYIYSMIQLYE